MGSPDSHYRQVAYVAPDIFVVRDQFVPNDEVGHDYEIRWQLDSLDVLVAGSASPHVGELHAEFAVIPMSRNGLYVEAVSAQKSSEFMGWAVAGKKVEPGTTLRHMKIGTLPAPEKGKIRRWPAAGNLTRQKLR